MAVNCWVKPRAIDGLAGITTSDTKVGGPTVSVVVPITPLTLAVMVAIPTPRAVARPVVAFTVATRVLLLDQVIPEMIARLPSV